jgi:DegV family protein with EDD domain
MGKIAIVTDTDASLPPELIARYGIHMVPINVIFGEETFETGVNINDQTVFERVDREGKLPTTSAPAPGKFAEVFETAFSQGADQVVCLCVSGVISATYNAALVAKEDFPDKSIEVVDTLNLSMAQGFMVLAAAEAAAEGASMDEVLTKAHRIGESTFLYAALSTLKYLAMSGRVGSLAAGMGNLLNVKPILTIQDGKLDLLERVRTRKKAWARVIELASSHLAGGTIERMAILHSAAPDAAEQFAALVRSELKFGGDVITSELTPGLSVHSGAGLVGLVIVPRAC